MDCLEETLEKSLQAKGSSNLRVSILLDYTRGSRGRYEALLSSKAHFTVGLDKCFFQREAVLTDWTYLLKSHTSENWPFLYQQLLTPRKNLQAEQLFF